MRVFARRADTASAWLQAGRTDQTRGCNKVDRQGLDSSIWRLCMQRLRLTRSNAEIELAGRVSQAGPAVSPSRLLFRVTRTTLRALCSQHRETTKKDSTKAVRTRLVQKHTSSLFTLPRQLLVCRSPPPLSKPLNHSIQVLALPLGGSTNHVLVPGMAAACHSQSPRPDPFCRFHL